MFMVKMMEMGMLEVVTVMVVPQLPATLGLVGLWVVVAGLVLTVVVWRCCGGGGHGDVGVSGGDDEYGKGAGYRGTKDTKDPISSRCVSLFYALYLHNCPGG